MPLNPKIEKHLSKTYSPQERYDMKLLGNELGEPVTLFIGTRRENGDIAGDRYVRRIVRKPGSDQILKSHWELKGNVARG